MTDEELHELADAGCPVIQMEEPQIHLLAARGIVDKVINPEFMLTVFNNTVKGLRAKTEVWCHTCWGNPSQQRMFGSVQSYKPALELLNQVDADVITFETSASNGADLELTGIPYPEEFGGGDQPYETYLMVVEEIARGYLGFAIGLSVHTLCSFAINSFGSQALKEDVLSKLCAGEWFGAYSLSEPNSGSDAVALSTRAERSNGSYKLTGSKVFCTRGNEADAVLVMARTGEAGARGVSAFIVEKGTPGFSGAKKEDKMGWRSSPTWMLQFDGAEIPEAGRIGDEGEGFKIALASLDSGRLGIAAVATGLAQGALDAALAYAAWRLEEREEALVVP